MREIKLRFWVTGLEDMHGKEIHENDILKGCGYGNLSGKWKVKFIDGEWKAISINNSAFTLSSEYFKKLELIDNIF